MNMIRLIILLVFICCGCSQGIVINETPSIPPADTYSQDSLYIYFTGGFRNDSLEIAYSGNSIIEADVTTNEALGFAVKNVLPGKGIDTIHVNLYRPNKSYSTEIVNRKGNFIEVWYCKDDVLKYHQRTEPFRFE